MEEQEYDEIVNLVKNKENELIRKFLSSFWLNSAKLSKIRYSTNLLLIQHLLKCNLVQPCLQGNAQGAKRSATSSKIGLILIYLSCPLIH